MAEGLENCRALDREVRAPGRQGGYSTVVRYVRPRRRHKQPETAPGEQAQVDWGSLPYIGEDGTRRRVRVFALTMGWSRACCVELVRSADTAAFIQRRVNAFEYLGGVPRRCLYDNAKVITLGRDEEKRPVWDRRMWNRRMLDFALRVGFEARLCQPYRAQTKGKVESGVKYVRRNMWPSLRFTDDADLNRQALEWSGVVANARVHGTTYRIPWEMLDEERAYFGKLPDRVTPAPYLREDRKVARDGLVSWEDSRCGVHWQWVGRTVQVGQRLGTVEIRSGDERIAVHPLAQRAGRRSTSPASGKACPGGWPAPPGGGGGAGPRRCGGAPLPGRVRTGCPGRRPVIALEQARKRPETLGLKQAVEALDNSLDNSLDTAAGRQLTYPEMLAGLLGVEVTARRERSLTTEARLANLAFAAEAGNILLLGPPGVGRTHLAVALALRAIENGQGAYFVRAYDLMEDLRKARIEHNPDRRMRVYPSPKGAGGGRVRLLALRPGVGHRPLHPGVSPVRAGQHHPDIEQGLRTRASNKGFGEWGEPLGDTVIATAALDRLLDHSHVLNIRGESFRLREKLQAGLFPSQQHLAASPEEAGDNCAG